MCFGVVGVRGVEDGGIFVLLWLLLVVRRVEVVLVVVFVVVGCFWGVVVFVPFLAAMVMFFVVGEGVLWLGISRIPRCRRLFVVVVVVLVLVVIVVVGWVLVWMRMRLLVGGS